MTVFASRCQCAKYPSSNATIRGQGQTGLHPTFQCRLCESSCDACSTSVSYQIPCELSIGNRGEEARMITAQDSAYAALEANRTLLRPYKQVSEQAVRARETFALVYQHGGALTV
jgi:hypothetical protein